MAPERRPRHRNAEVIEKAVIAVRNKVMSIRRASKLFDIPFETLRRHASGEARSTTLGRPPKFDRGMESELRETVKEMLNMGCGVGLEEVKELGMELCSTSGLEPFKKDIPSRGWARGFMARNNLTLKSSEIIPNIYGASRHCIEKAVQALSSGQSSSKESSNNDVGFLGPSGILTGGDLQNTLFSTSELRGKLECKAPENIGGVTYMGHIVGLEELRNNEAHLCTVELKDRDQSCTDNYEILCLGAKKCDTADASTSAGSSQIKFMFKKRPRAKRDAEEIERALNAINYEKFSIRQASKHFNIPFETLRRHIGKSKKLSEGLSEGEAPKCNKRKEVEWKGPVPVGDMFSKGHNLMLEVQEIRKDLSHPVCMRPLVQEWPPRDWSESHIPRSGLPLSSNEDSGNAPKHEIKDELHRLTDE